MQSNSEVSVYKLRQANFSSFLKKEGIFAFVISDFENSKDSSLRYLSAHPMDAVLIMFADSEPVLIPWDVNLAKDFSFVQEIKPYTDYNRDFIFAVKSVAELKLNPQSGKNQTAGSNPVKKNKKPVIEFSPSAAYPVIKKAEKLLPGFEIRCTNNGSRCFLESERMIKTDYEINCIKKACKITDKVLIKLEKYLRESVSDLTETDIALFIEKEGRKNGAEGTGFETLAASPERSFSIHPFPSYSDKKVPAEGLTIIDCGHKYKGYTSDLTTTVVRGKTTEKQDKMISLVKEATEIFETILKPGINTVELTKAVTLHFKKNGFTMPHALGHGIGLDVHEYPVLKDLKGTESELRPGMVFAIEPGVYSPDSGGVRLENDYLITEKGFERLSNSKIIRL